MSERFAIVMAGGSGTRFWPASRAHKPKQFLQLGSASESLLQGTVRRAEALVGKGRIFVVTNARHESATREQLRDLPRENLLLEPIGRNTAPCIAWATAAAHERAGGDALLAVLPADSHIGDEAAFGVVLERALNAASGGALVTIGVTPTRPETGYGYVQIGAELAHGVHRVSAFVEKPTLEVAQGYLASGKHLWNSGMFFFRADAMQSAIARTLPELASFAQRWRSTAASERDALIAREFPQLPSVSIDYGVMEKERDLAVVPGAFGWDDVGSFSAAWQLAEKDGAGNASRGDALFEDASGCYTSAPDGKLIALLGVHDLVVVDTADALLVMPRERAQDVRKVVDALTKTKRTRHL